jgi:hypothetical protein
MIQDVSLMNKQWLTIRYDGGYGRDDSPCTESSTSSHSARITGLTCGTKPASVRGEEIVILSKSS